MPEASDQGAFPWRARTSQSAKRVRLAVRTSISSFTRPPPATFHPEEDGDRRHEDATSAENIDEAMRSLYSADVKETLWTQLQQTAHRTQPLTSYVPRQDFDAILDDGYLNQEAKAESERWLMELENGGARRFSELEDFVRDWERRILESEPSDCDDFEDDEFGEFQSAVVEDEDVTVPTVVESTDIAGEGCEAAVEATLAKDALQGKFPQESHSTNTLTDSEERIAANDTTEKEADQSTGNPNSGMCTPSTGHDSNDTVSLPVREINLPALLVPNGDTTAKCGIETVPTSLQIPWNDYSTAEGRFLRRRRQHFFGEKGKRHILGLEPKSLASEDSESVEENEDLDGFVSRVQQEFDLPSYFFTNPDIDDTSKLLQSLPWHSIMALYSKSEGITANSDLVLWDDYMTNQMCDMDAALDRVQKLSLERVQPHELELAKANDFIHDFDQNLRLADMYFQRSLDLIQKAKGDETTAEGLLGSLVLLDSFNSREDYHNLNYLLNDIVHARVRLQDLGERIGVLSLQTENGLTEYETIVESLEELHQVFLDGSLSKLKCLDSSKAQLRALGQQFWTRVETQVQSTVVRLCRRMDFDWSPYKRLLKVGIDFKTRYGGPSVADLPIWWSKQIALAFHYEAERSFALALVQPAYASDFESDFQKEIEGLGEEIDADWGDVFKLRNLTHNLVMIRFDFESPSKNFLLGVVRRLCESLRGKLEAYWNFVGWHEALVDQKGGDTQDARVLRSIGNELEQSKIEMWNYCESVILRCLDEYLKFGTTSRKLFKRTDSSLDESLWIEELEELSALLLLLDHFVARSKSMMQEPTWTSIKERHELVERLGDVFRRHLRVVHVEAMNTSGRMLASESWILNSFCPLSAFNESEKQKSSTSSVMQDSLSQAFDGYKTKLSFAARWSHASLDGTGVCFDVFDALWTNKQRTAVLPNTSQSTQHAVRGILRERHNDSSVDDRGVFARLAPQYVTDELVKWNARLIAIMRCLPLITKDTSEVVANLCDLYLTTVFRICAGSASNEQLLLGSVAATFLANEKPNKSSSMQTSTLFRSFRRTSKNTNRLTQLPDSLEAEMCEPLPKDKASVADLRHFVVRAQKKLTEVVNLDKVDSWLVDESFELLEEEVCKACGTLEKRISASVSLHAVSALMEALLDLTIHELSLHLMGSSFGQGLTFLTDYVDEFSRVVPTMVSVSSKIAFQRALQGRKIVSEVVSKGSVWEESKLNEEPNDYVERICERCSLFWGYMKTSGKLPDKTMSSTWAGLLTAAYVSMHEGFARIPYCSTEGRALMTLDLASFTSGVRPRPVRDRIQNISPGSAAPEFPENLEIGMQYVNTYVKVFYYPEDDVIQWIHGNFHKYRLNHVLTLLDAIIRGSRGTTSESEDIMRAQILSLYEIENPGSHVS